MTKKAKKKYSKDFFLKHLGKHIRILTNRNQAYEGKFHSLIDAPIRGTDRGDLSVVLSNAVSYDLRVPSIRSGYLIDKEIKVKAIWAVEEPVVTWKELQAD